MIEFIRWDCQAKQFVCLVNEHPVFKNEVSRSFAAKNPERFLDAATIDARLARTAAPSERMYTQDEAERLAKHCMAARDERLAAPSEGLAIPTWQERRDIWLKNRPDCPEGPGSNDPFITSEIRALRAALSRTAATEQAKPELGTPYAYEMWDGDDPKGREDSFMVFGSTDPVSATPDHRGHFWKSMPLYAQPVPQASGDLRAAAQAAVDAIRVDHDCVREHHIVTLESALQSTGMRCTICCAKAGDPHVPGCSDAPVPRSVEDAMMVLNAERARRWVHRGPERRRQQTESVPNLRQGEDRRKR